MNFVFFNKKTCMHNEVSPYLDSGYCPECGEYVYCNWYMVRCSCCNIKRVGIIHNNIILPKNKFCTNCGSSDFYIVKLQKINFIDLKYTIFKKETNNDILKSDTSIYWVEDKEENLKTISQLSF